MIDNFTKKLIVFLLAVIATALIFFFLYDRPVKTQRVEPTYKVKSIPKVEVKYKEWPCPNDKCPS